MKRDTIHFLTQDELRRLLAVLEGPRDVALFYVGYLYGVRASEIGLLERTHVDLKNESISIPRLNQDEMMMYDLNPKMVYLLQTLLDSRNDEKPILFPNKMGGPISRRMLDYLMKAYGEAARLPDEKRHFHALRHTTAVHLLQATGDIWFVQKWLGHKNIQNTMVYTELVDLDWDTRTKEIFSSEKVL